MGIERFLTGSVDAAAVLAGFQVTALTLLLSIADKPVVERLKKDGHYERLIGYHWQAILAVLVWLVASLILLAVQGSTLDASGKVADLGAITRWSAVIVASVCVTAGVASYRVTKLLVRLLRITART